MNEKRGQVRILQRCGACEHEHRAGLSCALCGCCRFRLHPEDLAEAERVEAEERAERGGRATLLDSQFAAELLKAFDMWEKHTFRGWDLPPLLCRAVVRTVDPADKRRHPGFDVDAGLGMALVQMETVPVPMWFYRQCSEAAGDNFVAGLQAIADGFEMHGSVTDALLTSLRIDPRVPAVAWMWIGEAYMKDQADRLASAHRDPSLRRDEMRSLVAVDADERQYHVQRIRYGHYKDMPRRIVEGPTSPRRFRQVFRDHAAAHLPDVPFEELGGASGMPRINEQLTRLVRCSTTRAETRALFASLGTTGQPGDG